MFTLGSKSILISGGTGFFGQAFVRRLLGMKPPPSRIIVFSRGEYRQFLMAKEFEPLDQQKVLRFMIGDVRERDRLKRALDGVELVVHAAALKRIEVGHYNPLEMVKTNINGSTNLVEAAQDAGVRKVVFLSSDKAFEPVSPYGLSKAMAEAIFIAANNTTGWTGPKFSTVKYGNVWGSTGSVVPVWRDIIRRGEYTVPVSDPECTRFFMRMEQAIDLVLYTFETMKGGEINIPTLPAYRLGDLATAMNVKMDVRGLPSYEKLHEAMAKGNSSDKARRMSVEELRKELASDEDLQSARVRQVG